jgi:hypothetical protein
MNQPDQRQGCFLYMMSGGRGMGVIVMGRTHWDSARRQFRDFLAREPAY